MNQQFRFGHFNVLPPVIKNLLIINGLFFLATYVLEHNFGIDVINLLGLHYWTSDGFRPFQIFTHLFMHGSFDHIFFNMFSLWMFGAVIENYWGGRRFLVYYLVTGLGAALIHNFTRAIDIYQLSQHLTPEAIAQVKSQGYELMRQGYGFKDYYAEALNSAINGPTVGASGAVYGVLMAFGIMFPNSYVYLYFMIPIRVKYLVIGLIVMEVSLGLMNNPGDNIAHFAHLGGMIFGYLLIKYWNKTNRKTFY